MVFFGKLLVQMQGLGVMGHGAEHDVVHFRHRAGEGVVEFHAHLELFEIKTGHFAGSFPSGV